MDDDDELLTITIVALTIYCVPCYSAILQYMLVFLAIFFTTNRNVIVFADTSTE